MFQRWVMFVCLVAFGLGQTLLSSLVVRCTDSSGVSRVELGCAKSAQGACLVNCCQSLSQTDAAQDEPEPVTPCTDEPIGPQLSTLKLFTSEIVLDPALLVAVLAIVCDEWTSASELHVAWPRGLAERERPPDSLAHLCTVILLV
jgi:hypothetical protein